MRRISVTSTVSTQTKCRIDSDKTEETRSVAVDFTSSILHGLNISWQRLLDPQRIGKANKDNSIFTAKLFKNVICPSKLEIFRHGRRMEDESSSEQNCTGGRTANLTGKVNYVFLCEVFTLLLSRCRKYTGNTIRSMRIFSNAKISVFTTST
ncbi:13582_t:CDS:2 [Funneliformis caledonium]|uniref:13582_t:CDS:1 n=1 Tax=Funneliformis caledonium TaxID=1117310 RepID=A0A9N9ABX1_9GLOM|nr:13582_t:CDS:2 [Funneliformis caledonium]